MHVCPCLSMCPSGYTRLHQALVRDEALTALGKVLHLLNGILDGQVGAPGMAEGGRGAGGRAQGLLTTDGLSRGVLSGADPRGHELPCAWTLSRTVLRDRVMSSGSLSLPN